MKSRRTRDAATALSAELLQETTVFCSGDCGLFSFSCRYPEPVRVSDRVPDRVDRFPRRRQTTAAIPGSPLSGRATGEAARAERSRSFIIRRKETGVRVGSHAPFPGAATDLSVRQKGGLFARIAPRTDGILVPMRKNSRADGRKFPWARERSQT